MRRVRVVYGTPASEDAGSVEIGVGREETLPTGEDGLRRTVRFIDMAALRTFTRRVPGIYLDHRYARKRRLVKQKQSQLGECPAMQNRSLRTPSPDPQPDVPEVFKNNRLLRASGVLNDLLRYYVVGVGGETGLLARQFPQLALCAASLFLLEFGPQAAMAMSDAFDGST